MKTSNKNRTRTLLTTLLIVAMGGIMNAQIIFDDDVNDGTPAPIDGFIGVAVAAGAALGLRKKLKQKSE